MVDLSSLKNARLCGDFMIDEVELTAEPIVDAIGREAVARTRIVGEHFHLLIRSGLGEREMSITLYHEILEAASVASLRPPAAVCDFNEADFERAAHKMHEELGMASAGTLNRMLQSFGFGGEYGHG